MQTNAAKVKQHKPQRQAQQTQYKGKQWQRHDKRAAWQETI